MKRPWIFLLLLLSAGVWAAPALAGKDPNLEARRQQIHDLIMIRLNNALDLSPEQSAQISQVLKKYRQEKWGYRTKLRQMTAQLGQISSQGREGQIQALIAQITETRAKLDQVDDRMFAEAKKHLNTRQQGQFLFVMDELRRQVQAVKRGAPPPGGGVNAIQGQPGY